MLLSASCFGKGIIMRIYLRDITLADGANIVKWRNAPQVTAHCFNKKPITIESNEKFYKAFVETGKYKQFIVERIDEDFGVSLYSIATVYLKDIDLTNKRCQLCVFTSDDQEWNTESQSIAIRMLLEKAFNEYGMHKVYSYVFAEYQDEIELLKHSGFRLEAILESEALDSQGNYSDVIRMCVIKK